MQYTSHYRSPIGNILLAADEIGLTGLWFEGQKYFALYLDKEHIEKEIPVLEEAKKWLDIYLKNKNPEFHRILPEFLFLCAIQSIYQKKKIHFLCI